MFPHDDCGYDDDDDDDGLRPFEKVIFADLLPRYYGFRCWWMFAFYFLLLE